MIQDIEINSMEDLFHLVSEQQYREDLGRHRNLFIYRVFDTSDFNKFIETA